MTARRVFLVSLLALILPLSGSAQLLDGNQFLFTGILDRFPDTEGRMAVRTRDGELVTLLARGARVEVGSRGPGTWEDLRPGAILDVYGERRGGREAVARRLVIVGGETGVPPREAIREWREGGRRDITGRVTAVDPARESLRVRVGEDVVAVEAFDRTRFLRDGRRIRLRDIRVGARVRARGQSRSGRLLAEEVVLLERDAPRAQRAVELDGVVQRSPRYPRRTLALRVGERAVEVEVPASVPILWQSRRLLLHALEPGDRIRVEGARAGTNRIRAERVTVLFRVTSDRSRGRSIAG